MRVQTILELLNEIRWNDNLRMEDYEIGYYDRIDRKIIRLELRDVIFDSSDKFAFVLKNIRGKEVRIPYHRIKRVWKQGELVWKREIR